MALFAVFFFYKYINQFAAGMGYEAAVTKCAGELAGNGSSFFAKEV